MKLIYPATNEVSTDLVRRPHIQIYLAQLSSHHQDTYLHSRGVGSLCVDLCLDDGLSGNDVLTCGSAGMLHDVGKLEVPLGILTKDTSLTAEEKRILEEHVRNGVVMLDGPEYKDVRRIIAGSHEFQKDPYPRSGDKEGNGGHKKDRRKNDETILRLSQIVAIADMCDALIHPRDYKGPLAPEEVRRALKDQFTGDPQYIEQVLARFESVQ